MIMNGHRTISSSLVQASWAHPSRFIVLEINYVGSGGSGRSSALVRLHYSFPPEEQLALVSLRMFESWEIRNWKEQG
jgi:glycine/D-amino acid oxidase-like deaminating enzyme